MEKIVYKSRIDWWLLFLMLSALAVIFAVCIGSPWWVSLLSGGSMVLMFVVIFCGCWYEIDGDSLVIYQFFMAHKFPISKIKEVRKMNSILASAALSTVRVSIKFTDRRILKSSMPIEISPKDRDGFINRLCKINPEIKVLD